MNKDAKVVLYGNCQSTGVAHFLRKAGWTNVEAFQNHQMILKEDSPERLTVSARLADIFICQPTSAAKHDKLSSEYYVQEVIPKSAKVITFPYNYSTAFHPLFGHGDAIMGINSLNPVCWELPKQALLKAYDDGAIEFNLWSRLMECAAEQSKRERWIDVKTTQFIVNEACFPSEDCMPFLNYNHPSSPLFVEMAEQVIYLATGKPGDIIYDDPNEANLPCSLPVSQYVINEFNWHALDILADPAAHAHYRELLGLAWEKQNRKAL